MGLAVPVAALALFPVLHGEIDTYWPDLTPRSFLAALIEQETCPSLKSKKCWNPRTELKTEREYGFGLGQTTVTARFNVWDELRKKYPTALKEWTWENRFDAKYQIRSIVLKMKGNYKSASWAATNEDKLSFSASMYNGGLGSVLKDRELCKNIKGCDPSRWFGHVEKHSYKSRVVQKGYGQSWFDINRGYVNNVWNVRRAKYIPYMDNTAS